jgi:hypothetical protein
LQQKGKKAVPKSAPNGHPSSQLIENERGRPRDYVEPERGKARDHHSARYKICIFIQHDNFILFPLLLKVL